MGELPEDPEQRHELLVFHCNFATKGELCRHPLKEGWVTACSHLFCYEHAKEWFQSHNDCPVCRCGKINLIRMDLSQASVKRRGRMSLIGMTPPEIIQASETALNFWVDQKVFEFHMKGKRQNQLINQQKSIEEHIKTKLREAEATCNALEAEQQQLQQQIDEKEKENRKVSEELQRLRWDLAAAEDRHNSLQKQVAGEQRQEVFRRPLIEVGSVSCASAGMVPASRGKLGEAKGVSHCNTFEEPRAASRTGSFTDFMGASASRKLPTFTPGFLGSGRVTKRKIT